MPDASQDRVARGVLVLCGLAFLAVGIAFLVTPVSMAAHVGITLDAVSSKSDLRAVYGGLDAGLGLFFLACAGRRSWVAPGLFAAMLCFVGLVAGRITSLTLDGAPGALVFLLFGSELLGAVGSAWGLFSLRPHRKDDEEPAGEGPALLDALK
ncbi:MAG TPA: DUF4345 domain-containing protein [Polyangiaceae bacterium]|nr:DUF4345 domain-containing protein [Polyangiaceae bacterium]